MAEGTYSAETSEWHPFFVFKDGEVIEKRADELEVGDMLVCSNPSLKENWPYDGHWDLEGLELDEEMAWLAGIFSTDGSLDEPKQGLRLRIFSSDQEIIDKALTIIEKKTGKRYAVETDRRSRSPVMRITVYNRILCDAIKKLNRGIVGSKERSVRIPAEAFKSPVPVMGAYLAGAIDGDGHFQKSKQQLELSGASIDFAEDLSSLFYLFGITSRYRRRHDDRDPTWADMHEVSVSGQHELKRLAELVIPHLALSRKKERLVSHISGTHSSSPAKIPFMTMEPFLKEAGVETANTEIWRKMIRVGNSRFFLGRWKEKDKINIIKVISLIDELLSMPISDESKRKLTLLRNVIPNLLEIKSVKRNSQGEELEFYDFTVADTNNYLAGNMGLSVIHNTGFCFSYLRPKGDYVKSTAGVASGPLSFMSAFDNATVVIKQGGKRRGANMATMHAWHPDVEEFITMKQTPGLMENFNVSVMLDDAFMDAVENNKDYNLVNPRDKEPIRALNARSLFKLIAYSAWKCAEPGVLFIDTINRANPTPQDPIHATNPCVTKDTIVTTNEGLLDIPKLHNPHHVLGGDGEYHPITWAGQTGHKEVFLVKTGAGYEVKATANHKMLTENGWKEVGQLTSDDELVTQKKGKFGKLHLEKAEAIQLANTMEDGVPEQVFSMDRESLKHFLSNFFEDIFEKHHPALNLHSSKTLKQIQVLLLQFGVLSEVDEENLQLNIVDEANLRVKNIEKIGVEPVYDLTEPSTHSFSANGLIVHNCGEVPMPDYESCNLGSVNLEKFAELDWSKTEWKKKVDWDRMRYVVRLAVQFLDNVIDLNKYPIPQIREQSLKNRRMGLGVMGFARMLYRMGIAYDSDLGCEVAEHIMKFINDEARKMSHELGRVRGSFPNFKESTLKDQYDAMRNATVTSIAPTGTISMISDTSSGIEPVFALSFLKTVRAGQYYYLDPVFEHVLKVRGLYSQELIQKVMDEGSIQEMEEIPDDVKGVFRVAHDISPEAHVKMQAAFQKSVELAVSKTINMPAKTTVEDVEAIYMMAWKTGCKGLTIYRDSSRQEQVLHVGKTAKTKIVEEDKVVMLTKDT
jgi:ribonucleoside-diphosphate reductase alpha chain